MITTNQGFDKKREGGAPPFSAVIGGAKGFMKRTEERRKGGGNRGTHAGDFVVSTVAHPPRGHHVILLIRLCCSFQSPMSLALCSTIRLLLSHTLSPRYSTFFSCKKTTTLAEYAIQVSVYRRPFAAFAHCFPTDYYLPPSPWKQMILQVLGDQRSCCKRWCGFCNRVCGERNL